MMTEPKTIFEVPKTVADVAAESEDAGESKDAGETTETTDEATETANEKPSAAKAGDTMAGSQNLSTALKRMASRRMWPVYLASTATILWAAGLGGAAYQAGILLAPDSLGLPELAALFSGLAAPIAVFWLIALVYQRTDPLLERRIEISQGMSRALAPIEAAERRLGDIRGGIERQNRHIEAATDIAAQRIDSLENRFRQQITDLFSATADADAKATAIREGLERQREAIAQLADRIESKVSSIENSVTNVTRDLGALIESARTESRAAAEIFSEHGRSARHSAQLSADTLREAGAQLDDYRRSLEDATIKARADMEAAFGDILSRADTLTARIAGLEDTAGTLTQALSSQAETLTDLAGETGDRAQAFEEALESQTSAMIASSDQSTERARKVGAYMAEQADQMDSIAKRIESSITEATDRALERLEAVETRLAEGAKTLEETAAKGADDVGRVSETMTDHAGMIAKVAGDAAASVRAAQNSLDERNAGLGQMLEEAKQRLEESEEQIARQQEALALAARSASEIIEDSSARLESRTREIGATAEATTQSLIAEGETAGAQLDRLRDSSAAARQQLSEISQTLSVEGNKTINKIRLTTDVLGIAAAAFGEERGKFEQDMKSIVGRLETGVASLHSETKRIQDEGTSAAERLSTLSSELAETADSTRETMKSTLSGMKAEVEDQFATLQTRFSGILDMALGDLERATDLAAHNAGAAAERITDQAESLVGKAEIFINKADELQDKLNRSIKDDFLRSSSLLVESLSSGAFDIGKVLQTDIPDNIWQRYLEGDRNIFARRTVKLGTRKMRQEIARKFSAESEFRDNVLKFMRDFESLMERVMSAPGANAMSVTLISSELGKLYVLLAQSMQKL